MNEEEYYCLKCRKFHSIDYNTHKRYALDLEKIANIDEVLREFGDLVDDLRERVVQLEKGMDRVDYFRQRKDRSYTKNWREL